MLELNKKSTGIFGLKHSGKSVLLHTIAKDYGRNIIVYDTLHEYPTTLNYNVYRPKTHSKDELFSLLHEYTRNRKNNTPRIQLFAIDEANLYFPGGGKSLDPRAVEVNSIMRHPPYEIGVIWVCRRPVELHPHITGLLDTMVIYQLSGANDIKFLNNTRIGLGDAVYELEKYHAIVRKGNDLSHMNPVEVDIDWKRENPE
jgi:hypothetical protein